MPFKLSKLFNKKPKHEPKIQIKNGTYLQYDIYNVLILKVEWTKTKQICTSYDADGKTCYQGESNYDINTDFYNWFDDKRHNKGIEYTTSHYYKGNVLYDGEWLNNQKHGFGILNDPYNNKIYEGNWKNGMRNGHGISYQNDYSGGGNKILYDGEWLDNKYSGTGTEYNNGETLYSGQWFNHRYYGMGIYYANNYIIEYTTYLNNVSDSWNYPIYHGFGIMYNLNYEKIYEGEFIDHLRDGKGIEYIDSKIIYEGEWKHNRYSGMGRLNFNHGSYEGNFRYGSFYGYGVFYDKHGKVYYKGNMDGQRSGYGTSYYSNGNIWYQGYWKQDKHHGNGVAYVNNKEAYIGNWIDDNLDGNIVSIYSSMNSELLYYRDKKCISCKPLTRTYDKVLNNLYEDLLEHTFSFLTNKEKANVKATSVNFNNLIKINRIVA
jgi:hypothetical protein